MKFSYRLFGSQYHAEVAKQGYFSIRKLLQCKKQLI